MATEGPSPHITRSNPVPESVRRILRGLPEWFGIDEAIDAYVEAAHTLTTYVALIGSYPGADPDLNVQDDPFRSERADAGSPRPGASRADDVTELGPDGHRNVVGVCLVEHHHAASSEIHLLAVEREHRREGIGRTLMHRAERDLTGDGRRYVQVKTLGPSHPSPEYAATRRFYEAIGYEPLQEFPADELWPGNPCLIMVKALEAGTPTA